MALLSWTDLTTLPNLRDVLITADALHPARARRLSARPWRASQRRNAWTGATAADIVNTA